MDSSSCLLHCGSIAQTCRNSGRELSCRLLVFLGVATLSRVDLQRSDKGWGRPGRLSPADQIWMIITHNNPWFHDQSMISPWSVHEVMPCDAHLIRGDAHPRGTDAQGFDSWRVMTSHIFAAKLCVLIFVYFCCAGLSQVDQPDYQSDSQGSFLFAFFWHLHSRSVEWCWEMLCAVEAIAVHLAWKLQEIISAVQSGLLGVALDGVPKRGAELAELAELWRMSFKVEVSAFSQVWTEHFVLNRASVPGRCKLGWHWSQLLMTRPEYDREPYGAS